MHISFLERTLLRRARLPGQDVAGQPLLRGPGPQAETGWAGALMEVKSGQGSGPSPGESGARTWEERGLPDAGVGRTQWLEAPQESWSQLLSASRAPFNVLPRHSDKEMRQSSEMRVRLLPAFSFSQALAPRLCRPDRGQAGFRLPLIHRWLNGQ